LYRKVIDFYQTVICAIIINNKLKELNQMSVVAIIFICLLFLADLVLILTAYTR